MLARVLTQTPAHQRHVSMALAFQNVFQERHECNYFGLVTRSVRKLWLNKWILTRGICIQKHRGWRTGEGLRRSVWIPSFTACSLHVPGSLNGRLTWSPSQNWMLVRHSPTQPSTCTSVGHISHLKKKIRRSESLKEEHRCWKGQFGLDLNRKEVQNHGLKTMLLWQKSIIYGTLNMEQTSNPMQLLENGVCFSMNDELSESGFPQTQFSFTLH